MKKFLKNTLKKFDIKIIHKKGWDYRVMKTNRFPTNCRVGSGSKLAHFLSYDPDDSIQLFHLRGEYYEQADLQLIAKYYRPGTFVDIGANVGNHAIFLAKTFPDRKIVCFEPHPRTYGYLYINIIENGLFERIMPTRAALSDRAGTGTIQTPTNNIGGSYLGNTNRCFQDEIVERWTCELQIGDEALSSTQDISFIKIDVEGHERECLSGLCKTIARWRPSVFVEVDNNTKEFVTQYFNEINYQLKEVTVQYHGLQNFLFLPKELW